MTPESITVSLEMAKALKEAGWEQDIYVKEKPQSQYVYMQDDLHLIHVDNDTDWILGNDYQSGSRELEEYGYCTAPTAEEILRELPDPVKFPDNYEGSIRFNEGYLLIEHDNEDWSAQYYHCVYGGFKATVQRKDKEEWVVKNADTLANAAAQMWVYLKEHNLLPTDND